MDALLRKPFSAISSRIIVNVTGSKGVVMREVSPMAYEVPIVPIRYVRGFVSFMQGRGRGVQSLMEGSGLSGDTLSDPDGFLSMADTLKFLAHINSLMSDTWDPFLLGSQMQSLRHDVFGVVIMRRLDPAEIMYMMVQYLKVCLPFMDLETRNFSNQTFSIRLCDVWRLGPLRSFVVKMYMGVLYSMGKILGQKMRIEFDFDEVIGAEFSKRVMTNATLGFNAPSNRFLVDMSNSEWVGTDWAACYPEGLEPSIDRPRDVVEEIRQKIRENPGRICTLEYIAVKARMAPRSVRKHLGKAGITFYDLRNEVRETFATRYLTQTDLTLEKIATIVGYSDQASFTKAYRGWTGRTPGAVRRSHRLGKRKLINPQ